MTPSVAPTVAAKQFLTLINTIFTYNYVNMTTDPSKLGDALVFLLTSTRDLAFVANSTGLTFEYVNKTLIDVYLCVNSTLTAKKTYEAFNWLVILTLLNHGVPDAVLLNGMMRYEALAD